MPSKEIARQNRICIVPVCNAKNSDFPDRIFFTVPENKKKTWLEIVGGDSSSIKPKKRLFCCENHFDVTVQCLCYFVHALNFLFCNCQVKRDVEGYDFYKHFGGRIKLMENAFPSKHLGDGNEFENVEEILPKEEPCDEPCDEVG